MITIRKATPKDHDALVDVTLKIMADGAALAFPAVVAATRENAALICAMMVFPCVAASDPILLAEENGALIGASITLIRKGPIALSRKAAYGSGWWVEPDHRRKGVLNLLLAETERILQASGVTVWEEFIFDQNAVAARIAFDHGFNSVMRVFQKTIP